MKSWCEDDGERKRMGEIKEKKGKEEGEERRAGEKPTAQMERGMIWW